MSIFMMADTLQSALTTILNMNLSDVRRETRPVRRLLFSSIRLTGSFTTGIWARLMAHHMMPFMHYCDTTCHSICHVCIVCVFTYAKLLDTHVFYPIAIETTSTRNSIAQDDREATFPFQRLSITLQRLSSLSSTRRQHLKAGIYFSVILHHSLHFVGI